MGMLYEPVVHRCPKPSTSGVAYELGTWWECDECGALWEWHSYTYEDDWKRRRRTKRVLRKIAKLQREKTELIDGMYWWTGAS